jgi:2'-5' RNA ligase
MAGARMRDHWAREQPWRADQRLWALYVTCGSIPSVVGHARQYQERLFGMRGLDLVEPRWLHLTVLGVAFVDEVDPVAMARLVEQASAIVAEEPAMEMVAGAPRARTDAVWMPVSTTPSLVPLRNRLEEAVLSCLGREPHALPLPLAGFQPLISVAYSTADAPLVDEVDDRLSGVELPPVHFSASHLSLLRLRREAPRWSWDAEQRIPFGGTAVP